MLGPSGGARFVDAELDAGMMRSVRKAKRDTPDLFAIDMNDEDNEAINIESIIHAEAMRRSADDEDSSDDDESEADFDVEDDDDEGPHNSDNSDGDGDKESGVGKKRRAITRGPVRCPLSSPCLQRPQNTKTQNTALRRARPKHKNTKHTPCG